LIDLTPFGVLNVNSKEREEEEEYSIVYIVAVLKLIMMNVSFTQLQ
jgi:hypothetical protein